MWYASKLDGECRSQIMSNIKTGNIKIDFESRFPLRHMEEKCTCLKLYRNTMAIAILDRTFALRALPVIVSSVRTFLSKLGIRGLLRSMTAFSFPTITLIALDGNLYPNVLHALSSRNCTGSEVLHGQDQQSPFSSLTRINHLTFCNDVPRPDRPWPPNML